MSTSGLPIVQEPGFFFPYPPSNLHGNVAMGWRLARGVLQDHVYHISHCFLPFLFAPFLGCAPWKGWRYHFFQNLEKWMEIRYQKWFFFSKRRFKIKGVFFGGEEAKGWCTPLKFNMEPENHPLEKENTSSKSSFLGSMLVFGGVFLKYFSMYVSMENIWLYPSVYIPAEFLMSNID